MQHISRIPAIPPAAARSSSVTEAIWQSAATEAHAIARVHTDDPATLKQLRRVCQLLTSHVVRERERRRAFLHLTRGCTREQASAMLGYLIPQVQARKAEEARALLSALMGVSAPADRQSGRSR
jgi:hypothetical protein